MGTVAGTSASGSTGGPQVRLNAGDAGEHVGEGHSVGQYGVSGRVLVIGVGTGAGDRPSLVVGGDGAGGVVRGKANHAIRRTFVEAAIGVDVRGM